MLFTKVFDEQIRIYGRIPEAVEETIRICMDQDILREYLGTRRKEVVTMMMDLYDQDRIMEIHIASERKIAGCKAVSVQRVREIETGMLQEHKEKMKKIGKMLA